MEHLKQIKERGYYKKYINNYNEIYIVGVEFNSEERNLIKCEWERI